MSTRLTPQLHFTLAAKHGVLQAPLIAPTTRRSSPKTTSRVRLPMVADSLVIGPETAASTTLSMVNSGDRCVLPGWVTECRRHDFNINTDKFQVYCFLERKHNNQRNSVLCWQLQSQHQQVRRHRWFWKHVDCWHARCHRCNHTEQYSGRCWKLQGQH